MAAGPTLPGHLLKGNGTAKILTRKSPALNSVGARKKTAVDVVRPSLRLELQWSSNARQGLAE